MVSTLSLGSFVYVWSFILFAPMKACASYDGAARSLTDAGRNIIIPPHHTEKPLTPTQIPRTVDIAIVGGGPAGLAAAIGIRRALGPQSFVSIAILERARGPTLREVGGQVGLMTTAFHALDALDPSGRVSLSLKEAGCYRDALRRYIVDGTLESELKFDNKDTRSVVIPWFKLQGALIRRLAEMELNDENHGNEADSNDVLFLGCELESLEDLPDEDHVLLSFTNGQQCRAKLVVGADGNLSKVRPALFGEEETVPDYAGSCIWRMFLKGDFEDLELGVSKIWSGDGKVLAMQKMGQGSEARVYVSGQSGWQKDNLHVLDRQRYIGTEDGDASGGTTLNKYRLDRFLKEFEQFPPEVLHFARRHCETSSILEHPIYYRQPGRPWGKGRVTLIGDAAHIMPPNMAMGTPSAFEDAVSLSHALAKHGLTPTALRAYEDERQPRVNRIAEAAIRQTNQYYQLKDDSANPFKMNNDPNLWNFIRDFKQEPVPAAAATVATAQRASTSDVDR